MSALQPNGLAQARGAGQELLSAEILAAARRLKRLVSQPGCRIGVSRA